MKVPCPACSTDTPDHKRSKGREPLEDRGGKGAARQARRDGLVPGVIYGGKQPATMISFNAREFNLIHSRTADFLSTVLEVKVGDDSIRVLARDVQLHPVTDMPLHVDLLRLSGDQEVRVDVAVHFLNEATCPGVKKGGVLNVVRHEIEMICAPDAIPQSITVDLAKAEIGDSIHISAVELPKGVRPAITDRDFTIATIAAPAVLADEDAAAESGDEA